MVHLFDLVRLHLAHHHSRVGREVRFEARRHQFLPIALLVDLLKLAEEGVLQVLRHHHGVLDGRRRLIKTLLGFFYIND